jgi:hypothetical protein
MGPLLVANREGGNDKHGHNGEHIKRVEGEVSVPKKVC